MKPLRLALCVFLVGTGFAVFGGDDWQRAAVGGLFGLLVGAMLETMPLLDWLYPQDDNDDRDGDG